MSVKVARQMGMGRAKAVGLREAASGLGDPTHARGRSSGRWGGRVRGSDPSRLGRGHVA